MAHAIILCGLAGWVIYDPPPHSWLPVAVLSLFVATVAIREFILAKQRRTADDRHRTMRFGN